MKTQKGFTLTELLVVIAIIGLLATIATAAFAGARAQARDAQRVANMNAVLKGLAAADEDGAIALDCTDGDRLSECTNLAVANYIELVYVTDPSGSSDICVDGFNAVCDYGVTFGPNGPTIVPSNFTVYFFLEKGSGSLGPGLHTVTQRGIH